MTILQAFEMAVQHHQAGRLADAESIYRQILAVEPQHGGALHLLGVIALQAGRDDAAVDLIGRASVLIPTDHGVHCNLGAAYEKLGRLDEAVAAYRRALELQPGFATAHHNLGNALKDRGQLEDAVASLRRALELRPDNAVALGSLGNALLDQGRLDEAIAAYRRSVELQPNLTSSHYRLGSALKDQGRLDEAIASYRTVLQLEPDNAAAHSDLGMVLLGRGQLDDSIASFRRVLQLEPDTAAAHGNLGNALLARGRLDDAIASYRRTLQLDPTAVEAHNNIGNALKEQGRGEEAIAAYRQAIQLQPDCVQIHDNLLLSLHYLADLDAEEIFREHCRWDEVHARPLAKGRAPHANDPDPERRLRIGYVSPDFRAHSVAYFLENLLASHDRGQVDVFCYADLLFADVVTARLREHAGHWRETIGMSDAQVAGIIRRDQIDILVDLSGHTAHNHLLNFARQPAPVQVTYLGYCDTTGMKTMDYRFTDVHADPPGTTEHLHTEQLVRLPETFACFRPADEAPPVGPLPALARGQVTFASFHTLAKINDPLLESWAGILQRVPDSRLIMVATGLDEASGRQRFSAFFGRHGIGSERLEFKGRVPRAEYQALHNEVDVLLDSHPFSGHTVGCHALWMGVPVVTLAGDRHSSRMMASVLTNVGLPELIAHTPAEYVEIAAALAIDRPRLAALRSSLRERMAASPLLDGPRFARNVEAAYRQMWRTWCNKQSTLPPT